MLKIKLPKQYNLGNIPGAGVFLYNNASGFIGIMLGFMNAGTFFIVVFSRLVPSASIWQFYIVLLFIYMALMIFTYMFITPSVISFGNWQAYQHENPVRADLKIIMRRLDEIEKTIRDSK